jgi:hypothetical protein
VPAQPLLAEAASLIEIESLKKRISIKKYRRNACCLFQKRLSEAKPSFDILLSLDHVFSVIRYSIFCGSLFWKREVSYEVSGVRNTRNKGCQVAGVPPSPSRLPTSHKLRRGKTEGRQVSHVRNIRNVRCRVSRSGLELTAAEIADTYSRQFKIIKQTKPIKQKEYSG